MIILLAIISTLVIGSLGSIIAYENRLGGLGLGAMLAVATMGGFILYAIRKNGKNDSTK